MPPFCNARSIRRVPLFKRGRDGVMRKSTLASPHVAPGSLTERENYVDARSRAGPHAIWDYLEARDPDAALRIDRLFSDAVAGLANFPMLGHQGHRGYA